MIAEERFKNQKKKALNQLKEAKENNEVDEAILPLLDVINSHEDYYTTSSCSGRITLFHEIGDKKENGWVGKWHRQTTLDELKSALSRSPNKGVVWFKYEAPIIHVAARSMDKARDFMQVTREVGYKRVGLQGMKKGRFVMEIFDTGHINCPIVDSNQFLVNAMYLHYLVKFANMKLERGLQKLNRLETRLSEL